MKEKVRYLCVVEIEVDTDPQHDAVTLGNKWMDILEQLLQTSQTSMTRIKASQVPLLSLETGTVISPPEVWATDEERPRNLTGFYRINPYRIRFDYQVANGEPPKKVKFDGKWYERSSFQALDDNPKVGLVWYERWDSNRTEYEKKPLWRSLTPACVVMMLSAPQFFLSMTF
jgi:hypothetical protein